MLRASAPDRAAGRTVPGGLPAAGFSDRIAVAADAAWPPTEGRCLNDAELEVLCRHTGHGLP